MCETVSWRCVLSGSLPISLTAFDFQRVSISASLCPFCHLSFFPHSHSNRIKGPLNLSSETSETTSRSQSSTVSIVYLRYLSRQWKPNTISSTPHPFSLCILSSFLCQVSKVRCSRPASPCLSGFSLYFS